MLNFKCVFVAVICCSSATSTIAEVEFSIAGLLGNADQEGKSSGFITISGDDSSIGIRGSMFFNDYAGLELSYHDFGSASESFIYSVGDKITDYLETTSMNLGIVGSIPLGDSFSIDGRLGIARWDFEIRETNSGFPGAELKYDDSGLAVYHGVGVQYRPVDYLILSLEYTVFSFDAFVGALETDQKVENVSLAIGYIF